MKPDFWHTVEKLKHMQPDRSQAPQSLALRVDSTESPEPMYDYDAVVHFIHVKTRIAIADVEKFLQAVSLYQLGLGLTADDADVFDITAAMLRARHLRLFPRWNIEQRCLDPKLQRSFIANETRLSMECVARMQDAEEDYMRRVGIIVDVVD